MNGEQRLWDSTKAFTRNVLPIPNAFPFLSIFIQIVSSKGGSWRDYSHLIMSYIFITAVLLFKQGLAAQNALNTVELHSTYTAANKYHIWRYVIPVLLRITIPIGL